MYATLEIQNKREGSMVKKLMFKVYKSIQIT